MGVYLIQKVQEATKFTCWNYLERKKIEDGATEKQLKEKSDSGAADWSGAGSGAGQKRTETLHVSSTNSNTTINCISGQRAIAFRSAGCATREELV